MAELNCGDYIKGRGAQINVPNRFIKQQSVREHIESIDDWTIADPATEYLEDQAKGIVNKVEKWIYKPVQ